MILSGLIYYNIAFNTVRADFYSFIGQYILLFALFAAIYKFSDKLNPWFLLTSAVLLRFVFFAAIPELSNDFYRFIWDGELVASGINPYAHTPNDLISHSDFMNNGYLRHLYHGMGELSQQNYSCYPTINQVLFSIPAFISDNISVHLGFYRLFTLFAELGVFFIGTKILKLQNLNPSKIWLYLLNPLVIIELTGNVHFEAVMIFFVVLTIYLILKNKWISASLSIALAIQVKLIPLILLPAFFKKIELRKFIAFASLSLLLVVLFSKPFLTNGLFQNFNQSLKLYFQSFEFNASIFYLIREIGFWFKNYDMIQSITPFLSFIVFALVISLVIKQKKTDNSLIFTLTLIVFVYYLFSTTVHPWYITLPLALSVFTISNFMLIWSLLIPLTYVAYMKPIVQEDFFILFFEYAAVIAVLIYDLYKNKVSTK